MKKSVCVLVLLIGLTSCQQFGLVPKEEEPDKPKEKPTIEEVEAEAYNPADYEFEDQVKFFLRDSLVMRQLRQFAPYVKVRTVQKDDSLKTIMINFNRYFSYIPLRPGNVDLLYERFKKRIDTTYHDYEITLKTLNYPLKQLIPNHYRNSEEDLAANRLSPMQIRRPKPIVRPADQPYEISNGLYNHPVAVWHSHGWYYNHEKDRWMWQRARLFGTVEDLFPMAFTLPYLVPMLEQAGANVFLPRERDLNKHEIIVDNNGSDGSSQYRERGSWSTTDGKGFAIGERPYQNGENPFTFGSARKAATKTSQTASVTYVPDIPERSEYAVYISYKSLRNSTENARYTVRHAGGESSFFVNQRIGGGTWIYLGTFDFEAGRDEDASAVILSNSTGTEGEVITADAIRIGGGMGVIERGGRTSGRPKYTEGARYWMQYAGMPQDEVYHLEEEDDYTDDYRGRGEWVNYLKGAPYGPNENRQMEGLGIPIDASIGFHTDAGVTPNDSTVGTMLIYSIEDEEEHAKFPDSVSRLANRDFADIVQSQIVHDIRKEHDQTWTRRRLYNAGYSESSRPNVPSILVELLSHQNFQDMKFGLDPEFQFDVARAIYKGTLRFIATQYGFDYVVQPLPVTHLSAGFNAQGEIVVRWKPKSDPLEPTAEADGYIVYQRLDDGGFDNGRYVEENRFVIENPETNTIYSFKVKPVNRGGAGMASEVVSIGTPGKGKSPVLIVNGFDRIAAPTWISEGDFEGFKHFEDLGVPDHYTASYTGQQYNFNKGEPWINDDEPGHGASRSQYEDEVIAGNNHDFIYTHATSILKAGYPVVSSSDEAVMDNYVDLTAYKYVNLILGEEKSTRRPRAELDSLKGRKFETFPLRLGSKVKQYLNAGGNIMVSGAYVGTDLYRNPAPTDFNKDLAENYLQFMFRSNYASGDGEVIVTKDGAELDLPERLTFNTELNDTIYQVEAADALIPADEEVGKTILRYGENRFSAATSFEGYFKTVILGFPIETITEESARDALMKAILNYFDRTRED